jgi:hypothetical protein
MKKKKNSPFSLKSNLRKKKEFSFSTRQWAMKKRGMYIVKLSITKSKKQPLLYIYIALLKEDKREGKVCNKS